MNVNNPFFSIIVPAHNSAAFIRKTLYSVRSQSYMDYELIVICDACTDNTEEIALQYADITLVCDCHRDGLTRNIGLDIARGEYIVFLDSDDWFLHEYVLNQIRNALASHPFDIFECAVIWKSVGYIRPEENKWIRMIGGHIIRREFIGDTRFNDKQYESDVDFLKAIIRKRPYFGWMDMPVYYYNYGREDSLSERHKKGEI